MRQIAAFLSLLLALTASAKADTILSISGPSTISHTIGSNIEDLAQSWTQTSEFSDVSVSAAVTGPPGSTVTAYLMTTIGTGTTTASQIAAATISPPTTPNGLDLFFSGLTLPAGTYYLVLSGSGFLDLWEFAPNANISPGSGVTYNGGQYSNGFPGYPPDQPYFPYDDTTHSGIMLVTGTPGTPATPEPGTLVLVLTSLCGAGALYRRLRVA